jgi:hypothetical protein
MSAEEILRGVIISFDYKNSYGFIKPDLGNSDVHFKIKESKCCVREDEETHTRLFLKRDRHPAPFKVGTRVVYISKEMEKGLRATHVAPEFHWDTKAKRLKDRVT